MAEGRSKFLWRHTSSVMALLVNLHRDPRKSSEATPSDFNPHVKAENRVMARVNVKDVKGLLMGMRGVKEGRRIDAREPRRD